LFHIQQSLRESQRLRDRNNKIDLLKRNIFDAISCLVSFRISGASIPVSSFAATAARPS